MAWRDLYMYLFNALWAYSLQNKGSQCSVPFDCPLKRKIQVVVKGQSSAESIRILWPQYLMKFRLRLFAVRYSLISVELDYINMPNCVIFLSFEYQSKISLGRPEVCEELLISSYCNPSRGSISLSLDPRYPGPDQMSAKPTVHFHIFN